MAAAPPGAPAGISIAIVGAKYDRLAAAAPPEAQQALCRALRALAHAHGAHLLFLGGLQPGGGAGAEGGGGGGGGGAAAAGKLRAQLEEFGRLMGQLLFAGADRKL